MVDKGLEMKDLPDYNKISFSPCPAVPFEEILPDAPPHALNLLKRFLQYPSKKRISAKEALLHPYLFTDPLPAHHSELPLPIRTRRPGHSHHAYEYHFDDGWDNSVISPELLGDGASLSQFA